jgi:hypothetical protein
MTRTIGFVPVRVGRSVVPVTVEAEAGAATHYDVGPAGARIIVAEHLGPDDASREVEQVLPEVQRRLALRLLN